MNTAEHISAKGEVHFQVWHKSGKLLYEEKADNLIVNVGKQSLAKLLSGTSGYANKRVAKIGFGTSNAVTAGTNTSLENPFVKALDSFELSGTSVIFGYALETSENNGVTIREMALFSLDDTMFSRVVRNPITKTADIRLTGTWKITF